jgi:hypothetical protein
MRAMSLNHHKRPRPFGGYSATGYARLPPQQLPDRIEIILDSGSQPLELQATTTQAVGAPGGGSEAKFKSARSQNRDEIAVQRIRRARLAMAAADVLLLAALAAFGRDWSASIRFSHPVLEPGTGCVSGRAENPCVIAFAASTQVFRVRPKYIAAVTQFVAIGVSLVVALSPQHTDRQRVAVVRTGVGVLSPLDRAATGAAVALCLNLISGFSDIFEALLFGFAGWVASGSSILTDPRSAAAAALVWSALLARWNLRSAGLAAPSDASMFVERELSWYFAQQVAVMLSARFASEEKRAHVGMPQQEATHVARCVMFDAIAGVLAVCARAELVYRVCIGQCFGVEPEIRRLQ